MSTIYVRAASPIWWLPDLTGLPLNDEYYIFFKYNVLPYLPQAVFKDPNGTDAWPYPQQFEPAGTLPNNLYFDPAGTYRIEIRHGDDENDPLIYLVENFVPGASSSTPTTNTLFEGAQNLATNPQFAEIFFSNDLANPYTITVAGTYPVAPGWNLVLTGAGVTHVNQLEFAATDNIAGNPSFALELDNTGWTTAKLVQRLNDNGGIFSGGSISMSVLARAYVNPELITLSYEPSGTPNPTTVKLNGVVPVGSFGTVSGARNVTTPAVNTNTGDAAYVDLVISLQGTGKIDLTNFQFVGQDALVTPNPLITGIPAYQETTVEQQINNEFHIYANSLITQPKANLLTGWNFGLNPWQFTSVTLGNVAANQYTADQTIVIQQGYVATATGNNVAVTQDSLANNYGYKTTAVTAHNQFAILQWIDPATIRPYWTRTLSVMARAFITTTHATAVRFKARLIYRASLPNTTAQLDPVAAWVEGSDPTPAATYTMITPLNDPTYTLTSAATNFSFDGFALPTSTNANMTLGLMLYTIDNMDQTATSDSITFADVSLVNNDFAIECPPETYDESLQKCQFYFETSYITGGAYATATFVGVRYASNPLGGDYSSTVLYKNTFQLVYNTIKRAAITPTFYSPTTGASANVQMGVFNGSTYPAPGAGANPKDVAIAGWGAVDSTVKEYLLRPANNTAIMTFAAVPGADQGEIYYHYSADARLGV